VKTAKTKKNEYGKRYSSAQKQAIIKAWLANLEKKQPQSKVAFCADAGITTITLGKWLATETVHKPAPVEPAAAVAEPVMERTVVVAQEPRMVAVVFEDDTLQLIEAIRARQAEIAELKSRLHQIVEAM
jgi:hypothetical protein